MSRKMLETSAKVEIWYKSLILAALNLCLKFHLASGLNVFLSLHSSYWMMQAQLSIVQYLQLTTATSMLWLSYFTFLI